MKLCVMEDCSGCRYWVTVDDEAEVGECHRYSPERDPRAPRASAWPLVDAAEWCGEHEQRGEWDKQPATGGGPRRKPGT